MPAWVRRKSDKIKTTRVQNKSPRVAPAFHLEQGGKQDSGTWEEAPMLLLDLVYCWFKRWTCLIFATVKLASDVTHYLFLYSFHSVTAKTFLYFFIFSRRAPPAWCLGAQMASLGPDSGAAGGGRWDSGGRLADGAKQMIGKNNFYLLKQSSGKQ